MGSSDVYHLQWNDFDSTLCTAFSSLKEDCDFIDVTLACEQQVFSAHKVVLSACSPYFKKILKVCQLTYVIKNDAWNSR